MSQCPDAPRVVQSDAAGPFRNRRLQRPARRCADARASDRRLRGRAGRKWWRPSASVGAGAIRARVRLAPSDPSLRPDGLPGRQLLAPRLSLAVSLPLSRADRAARRAPASCARGLAAADEAHGRLSGGVRGEPSRQRAGTGRAGDRGIRQPSLLHVADDAPGGPGVAAGRGPRRTAGRRTQCGDAWRARRDHVRLAPRRASVGGAGRRRTPEGQAERRIPPTRCSSASSAG